MLLRKRERLIRRIMVVEDEPLVAFDNERLLEDAGYEVVATVDNLADAARVIAETTDLHLVLTDLTLNGDGDGFDVARAAAARGIPVLFVSGDCPQEADSLCVGWLLKPYNDKALRSALEAVDETLQGRTVKKLPSGLKLHARG